jgi:FkbM family methyltransferase
VNYWTLLSKISTATPLQYLPVKVLKGPAKGAWWTLAPFSTNWRKGGGELDVATAMAMLPDMTGRVFWDFGAHFGIHTVGAARRVGPTGQVAAFEPDPAAFRRLHLHTTMNRLTNVRLYRKAASSSTRTERLYMPGGHGTSSSHLKYYEDNDMTGADYIEVSTVVPDRLVETGEIRLPDIIKIDVQGHGDQVILGCKNSIATNKPIIAFSNHSSKELSGTREVLETLGYRPRDFEGNIITWEASGEFIITPD